MNARLSSRTWRRVGGVVLVVVGLVAALTACSSRAPSDMIMLYYMAGAGDNKAFKECIEPGQSGSYPIDDETFSLPTSLRTWNIAPKDGDDNAPIVSGSLPTPVSKPDGTPSGTTRPGPEVSVWATATFYLNTDCANKHDSPIVQFWERTGRRPWKDGHGVAVDDDGDEGSGFREDAWRVMLQNTLVAAEAKAIRQESRNYSADALDANTDDVWTLMERQLGPSFNAALRDSVGGDYFCGPQYQRGRDVDWVEYAPDGVDERGLPKFKEVPKRGKCPPVKISITDVGITNADIARTRADVYAAEQRAKAALIDAQSKADVAAKLDQVGQSTAYVELQRIQAQLEAAQACRTNPNCTVIIDGTGGGVTVGAGRR
jgi:hypothetical protein